MTVGCIYKHPALPINDFKNEFISPLLLKLQKHQHSQTIFHNLFFYQIFFSKVRGTKSNILRQDWKKFEISKFISDFNQIKWEQILYNENNDVNFSMNEYLSKIDSLLDAHAPIKKINKKELEFLTKPWITEGLKNSIKKKNNIYAKSVKCKNKLLKEFYHNSYKNYRNLLSTLLKRAKKVLHKLL